MKRSVAAAVGVCGMAAAMAGGGAGAQPLETITLSVEWEKAVIGPGETNVGHIVATVSPQIGSMVAWNTPPGTGQPGKLIAFASVIFDLQNAGNALNGALAWTVPSEFNIANKPGTPDGNGGIKGTTAGQFVGNPNPNPNYNQQVTVLNLSWKETSSVGAYDVLFATKLTSAKVGLDVGLPGYVGENCVKIDGQGGFLVVPGPGVWAAMLAVPCVVLGRRRREGCP